MGRAVVLVLIVAAIAVSVTVPEPAWWAPAAHGFRPAPVRSLAFSIFVAAVIVAGARTPVDRRHPRWRPTMTVVVVTWLVGLVLGAASFDGAFYDSLFSRSHSPVLADLGFTLSYPVVMGCSVMGAVGILEWTGVRITRWFGADDTAAKLERGLAELADLAQPRVLGVAFLLGAIVWLVSVIGL